MDKIYLGIAGSGAVIGWLAVVQPILAVIATIVSIIAGIYAIRYYRRNTN